MIRGLPLLHHASRPLCHPHVRLLCMKASSSRQASGARFEAQTLHLGGRRLKGVSVGGVETCVTVPSLSLSFDTGRGPGFATSMRIVALTHGHCDHSTGLPLHMATRRMQKLPPAMYIVPREIAYDVKDLVDCVQKLEQTSFACDLRPLGPDDEMLEIQRDWFLKAFPTRHTVPSQGYLLYERKKRLKDEFRGLPGREIGKLRADGVAVEDFHLSPEIAFTGDTSFDAIENNIEVRRAKILVTEMTFIDQNCTAENARRFGHVHIDEVIAGAHVFAGNKHVVFTHFSARYGKEQILDVMQRLPSALRMKAVPLVGA